MVRRKNYDHLIGKKFGKLTVMLVSSQKSARGHTCMMCRCDCGTEKSIPCHHLTDQLISCGCWKSSTDRSLPTFMKKIEKTETCWLWKGMIMKSGYGKHCGSYAHRLSYEYHIGEIPEGKIMCHTCNNKACVNPHHMYPGTPKENSRDSILDGAYEKRSLTSKRWKR